MAITRHIRHTRHLITFRGNSESIDSSFNSSRWDKSIKHYPKGVTLEGSFLQAQMYLKCVASPLFHNLHFKITISVLKIFKQTLRALKIEEYDGKRGVFELVQFVATRGSLLCTQKSSIFLKRLNRMKRE